MKRIAINFKSKPRYNYRAIDSSTAVLFVPPVYNDLLIDIQETEDGEIATEFHNDVYLLFNQTRLNETLGNDSFKAVMDEFVQNVKRTANSELFEHVSDEQLFNFIKSRHYQSPSELRTWCDYLSKNFDMEYDKYMSYRQKMAEQAEKEAREKRDKELEEYLKRKNNNNL